MPDTGAPWNIPYVEPSDLVRNYPAAAEDLADAIAAGLTAAESPGIGSNAVVGTMTSNFTNATETFADATGCAVTITPSSATSRVLVLFSARGTSTQQNNTAVRVRITASAGATDLEVANGFASSGGELIFPTSAAVLHSPGSAAAVTYQIQIARSGGSGGVLLLQTARLTAIEVAA